MTITELAMYNALRSLEQKVQAIEPENCVWTERDIKGWYESRWYTSCGTHYVITLKPSENRGYNFCPNCGKRIKEIPLGKTETEQENTR